MTATRQIVVIAMFTIIGCSGLVFILFNGSAYLESISWYGSYLNYMSMAIALTLSVVFLKQLAHRWKFEKDLRNYFGFPKAAELTLPYMKAEKIQKPVLIKNDFESLRLRLKDYAVHMTDANGIITSWSEESEKLYGYSQEEMIGKSSSVFHTKQDLENSLPQFIREVASQQGAFENEGWRVKKNETAFLVNSFSITLFDQLGSTSGYLEFSRDHYDTQFVQGWSDPAVADPADKIVYLNRNGLAGCILNWEPGGYTMQSDIPLSIEIMALSNPGVEETLKRIFESGSWQPKTNFLFLKGYHFSELLRKNLKKANGEEITAIIFIVRYSRN